MPDPGALLCHRPQNNLPCPSVKQSPGRALHWHCGVLEARATAIDRTLESTMTANRRTTQDAEATALAMAQRRVKTEKQDLPVETMVGWVARGKLILQPAFQRFYVWDRGKASRLIESLLL